MDMTGRVQRYAWVHLLLLWIQEPHEGSHCSPGEPARLGFALLASGDAVDADDVVAWFQLPEEIAAQGAKVRGQSIRRRQGTTWQ